MDFGDDVLAQLVTDGVGTLNVNMFLSSKSTVPTGDGPYLSVIDTGGGGVEETHNSRRPAYIRPGAQITVRASTWEAAYNMALLAWNSLTNVLNQSINGVWYLRITASQNRPYDGGPDAQTGRVTAKFNVIGWCRPS